MNNYRKKEQVLNIVLVVLMVFVAVFFALPFIYMLLMSIMESSNSIFQYPPKFYTGFHIGNYKKAFESIAGLCDSCDCVMCI